MALGTGDRRGLNTWLARLPMEAKEKYELRYWQADLLLERGREAEAKEILNQLMQQRGFYPMVAAHRIGDEYELKIDKAPQNVDSALTQGPEMARVRELMYWNLDNTARSEWANLVNRIPVWRVCLWNRKRKMNGVTGRRIYCWNADVKLKKKRFCINSCNSVVSTRWLLHNASAKSMS